MYNTITALTYIKYVFKLKGDGNKQKCYIIKAKKERKRRMNENAYVSMVKTVSKQPQKHIFNSKMDHLKGEFTNHEKQNS